MPFKDFVNSVALPESDLDTYLMRQVVATVTSGTRPSSPPEGEPIWETDTDKLLIYTTATTLWQPPWNLPWGRLDSTAVTANQNTISTAVDLTGLTRTVTVPANRRVRISAHCVFQQATSGAVTTLYILDGAAIIQESNQSAPSAGSYATHTPFTIKTPSSGSHTYKLQAGTSSNTMNLNASATAPAFILVEDVGPDSAPA